MSRGVRAGTTAPGAVGMWRLPPRVAMTVGALGVSSSAVFIELSGTDPGTASFFRCLLALPVLLPLCAPNAGDWAA